jgi:hypothetical protein
LERIIIPSTVKTIGGRCFSSCKRLQNVSLPVDSELVRIEEAAFQFCCSLRSLFLASSVEFVGARCFGRCHWFSSLAFGSPSHLRELLDLPCGLSGFISIPDSVEILGLFGSLRLSVRGLRSQVLIFGAESRLSEIRTVIIKAHDDQFDSSIVRRSALVAFESYCEGISRDDGIRMRE